tara:strand:- start:171 stop:491 length:321 start_codon:yes stop_codon:yes gene_type:complete
MNLPPRDYTVQENIISGFLSEFGLRYVEQYDFFPYTVDFFIPELNMVIEADGKYGHLRKRDRERDMVLSTKYEVEYILHIDATTKERIKDTLWQGLNRLNLEVSPE